ncbi:MAG: MBL fold metallo-hydrolase [Pseudomonadota bacterium]|nr:MAG: MBL fold metallo-hydrolase [Pseudomonadota bacterium]
MSKAPTIIDFDHGISAIDTEYVRPMLAASHLLVDGGEAAFIDTGTTYSVPLLLAALHIKGIAREQVRWVCVTHVHLDHAGGAGALMRELPNATLVAHPRAAPHMIDPGKLIAGTVSVYGEEKTRKLYGEIGSVPEARVRVVQDGDRLELGTRTLTFIDTPGHAFHHYCIVDKANGVIFSGDTFGLSYRELDTARGAFIFPTTTPVHFEPELAHASVDRLMGYDPEAIFLTHYSRVTELPRLAGDLHAGLDALVAMARRHANAGTERGTRIAADMRAWLAERLAAHGCRLDAAGIDAVVTGDVRLNTQGLEVWLDRQSRAS